MNPGFHRLSYLPVLAAAVLLAGCGTGKKPEPTGVAWLASYDEAVADAGKKARPILLNFYTEW